MCSGRREAGLRLCGGIKRQGEWTAVLQAEFRVRAEMPSRARSAPREPVVVQEYGQGRYGFRIALKKYGEWAITLDFSKPERDRVVKNMIFGRRPRQPIGQACARA
ncbi:MAG: hypothetical protein CM1200mP41_04070 [Gammaproteobacteria bacterium]|nr:MAG: hypothetical protein CM1200mP41_04070 [Gammaproteobacteria bacterium]